MAEAQLTELSPVTDQCIAQIAGKTFTQHLQKFALTLLGLKDVQYDHAVNDAKGEAWGSCYNVLRIWYNRAPRTVRDLRTMLKEAEARGFVEKDAHDLVLNGTQPAYLTSGQILMYPDLASMLRSWYKDPMWQNLNLYPWIGDQWALRLSEVYTRLEMVTFTGNLHQRETQLLGDYRELFTDIQPEGTRILVKGDPGIGKTTFTHKLSYDWATGNLPQFHLVLVLKLKFSRKDQKIENMLVDQFPALSDNRNETFSEILLGSYLKSGRDKILLVLDGLDEIKLKEFPHIQKILRGEAYRKCCILATTRPHIAETCQNKATSVAKILGFSREKAEEFASKILSNDSERLRFFQQIDERNMSEMASVPILVLSLALLFGENKQLPDGLKATYDELVLYLRKTCEDSKGLTEDEIREAMDKINELAFKGLTRDDRQLVFPWDEMKDEMNIMKLGLLAAEKSGSGRRPTIVLYFLHKSLQEYCASDHVTKELENGNRRPWELLVQNLQNGAERESPHQTRGYRVGHVNRNETATTFLDKTYELTSPDDIAAHTSSKEAKLEQKKTKPTVGTNQAHHVGVVGTLVRTIEPRYGLKLSYSLRSEAEVVLRKIHPRLMKNQSPRMYASLLRRMNSLLMKNDLWFMLAWPYFLKRTCVILELLEELSEPLFIFIIEKLPTSNLELIIAEITELIIGASLDENTGSMLYLHNIRDGIEEYVKGKRPQSKDTTIDDILMKNPTLIDFTQPLEGRYSYLETLAKQPRFAALRVTGTGGEDDSDFLRDVNHILKTMRNIHTAELDDLSLVGDEDVQSQFIHALCQSPLECLELFDLDPLITKVLLEKLTESVRYLSICQGYNDTMQTEPFRLLPAGNLTTLHLENCVIDLTHVSFPNLRHLIIDRVSVAPDHDALALIAAMRRMLKLKYLGMHRCGITSLGPLVVKLLQQSTLRHVLFNDCNLSAEDGELILEAIEGGKLDHIFCLRLFGHRDCRGLEQRFEELCHERNMALRISAETLFDIDDLIATTKFFKSASEREPQELNEDNQQGDHDETSLQTLFTGIIQNQAKDVHCNCIARAFNKTFDYWQMAKTSICGITPEIIDFSDMPPEWWKTVTTNLLTKIITQNFNVTSEQCQTFVTSICNMTQEQLQTVVTQYFNANSEQLQTALTTLGNIAGQLQTAMPGLFSVTPELVQATTTSVPHITQEIFETFMLFNFNTTPELIQTAITDISNMTPEQIETTVNGILKMTPEQLQAVMTHSNTSSLRPQLGNSTNEEAQEEQCASTATDINSSVSQEPARNDTEQTMMNLISDFFSDHRVHSQRPRYEATQLQIDLSTIHVPWTDSTDDSTNHTEAGEPNEDSHQDDGADRKYNGYVDDIELD